MTIPAAVTGTRRRHRTPAASPQAPPVETPPAPTRWADLPDHVKHAMVQAGWPVLEPVYEQIRVAS